MPLQRVLTEILLKGFCLEVCKRFGHEVENPEQTESTFCAQKKSYEAVFDVVWWVKVGLDDLRGLFLPEGFCD